MSSCLSSPLPPEKGVRFVAWVGARVPVSSPRGGASKKRDMITSGCHNSIVLLLYCYSADSALYRTFFFHYMQGKREQSVSEVGTNIDVRQTSLSRCTTAIPRW